MDYLPFLFVAAAVAVMGMPLYIWLSAKRMQGSDAPDYAALLTPEQRGLSKLMFYFHSAHCGPCRTLTPVVDAMAARYGNVVKVDAMQQPAVAQRFGVRATPTLVLVDAGKVVKVMLGSVSEKQLELLLR